MPQTHLNSSIIAKEALRQFKNALGFTRGANRQYDSQFAGKGAKVGNTINVRLPHNFEVTDGKVVDIQATNDRTVPLTLNKRKHVAFSFDTEELTLNIEDFSKSRITPAAIALANRVDIDGLSMAKLNIAQSVGTPASPPTNLDPYLEAHMKLDYMACPEGDRTALINPRASSKIVGGLVNLQHSAEELKKQYRDGVMSRAAGFDWRKSVNIGRHTIGQLGGSPLVDLAGQSGDEINLKGFTTAAANRLKAGDVITFAGVYSVNPVTLEDTDDLKQFVITADCDSDVSGDLVAKISPAIVLTGPYRNVSASPGNEAVVKIFGHASDHASKVTTNNLVYHKDAFILGCADLYLPKNAEMASVASDEESGLSIRFVRAYDIRTDELISRLDVLYGWLPARPEWACRVQG
jgi:hypothetical protein